MSAVRPLDAMAVPLEGLTLIEASAGTGKTFTIANLYLRLVVEHRLSVDQILVVTFTEAATAELQDRVRRRLRAALDAGVHLVKPSLDELSALAGEPLEEASACGKAAELVAQGRADIVALTLGARGAWVVTRERALRLPGRPATVCSTVGAGDSFVGGMVWALARGAPFDDACRYALAASAASVEHPGTALGTRADVERIHAELVAQASGAAIARGAA